MKTIAELLRDTDEAWKARVEARHVLDDAIVAHKKAYVRLHKAEQAMRQARKGGAK